MHNCGGCRGEGNHRRFCPAVHGNHAWVRYRWSQQLADLGDEIGANNPEVSNLLYHMSANFRAEAEYHSIKFQALPK